MKIEHSQSTSFDILRFVQVESSYPARSWRSRERESCTERQSWALAEAWQCSREYRGERSRLLGASSHSSPSALFSPRPFLSPFLSFVAVGLSLSSLVTSRLLFPRRFSLGVSHRFPLLRLFLFFPCPLWHSKPSGYLHPFFICIAHSLAFRCYYF